MTGLRIFEKHPEADAYRFGPSFTPHAIVATEKRFTDAELAAEVWAARERVEFILGTGRSPIRTGRKLSTLLRFACLPHYDEEPS